MVQRVYLETTIPSYLTAWPSRDLIIAGHQQITQEWWRTRRNKFDLCISQFVNDEASAGDAQAAQERMAKGGVRQVSFALGRRMVIQTTAEAKGRGHRHSS